MIGFLCLQPLYLPSPRHRKISSGGGYAMQGSVPAPGAKSLRTVYPGYWLPALPTVQHESGKPITFWACFKGVFRDDQQSSKVFYIQENESIKLKMNSVIHRLDFL